MAVDALVGGRWLREIGPAGDLSWVTRWPGGLSQVSWTMTLPEGRRLPGLSPGASVQLRDGGISLGWGQLTEPNWAPADTPGYMTASFTAKGLAEQAAQFLCLDGSGVGTSVADTAIDAAIGRGWNVTRAGSFSSSPLTADAATTQSNQLPTLLDGVVKELGENWGVDPDRCLFRAPNLSDVMWHVTPGQVDLGVADDNFATDVYVNYLNEATGAGGVEPVHDPAALAMYGGVHKEAIVNAIGLGPISTAQAHAIGVGVFAQARVSMGWTGPMTLNSSQLLDAGGNPANLDRVAAHQTVRIHGVFDARVRLPHTDIVIGECNRARGADTVTIAPMGAVGRTLQNVIEKILKDAAAKAFQA